MANSDVLVRMKADTQNYDANIAKARRQLDQFKKDNLSLGGVMKQTTSAMVGMAAQFASVTAAIAGAKKVMSDMININKAFEQGTANLASIMGQSREEIVKLTNQAKQLGAATRYTAMQITELQTNLARLGFTQQEILNSTTAVQALATATGADLGEAANLAGAALRGFGLNATEMERVASVLAVSTTKSALSFDKLATAVPIVAPVAKQFGFTIEDTVTLLGKLSDAGMDASTAATATRNIFLKMANDSGKLAQALGRPVHSVEEFGEALAEMRKKGMSLNDILQMVGVRSTAAFAVFADNAETLKDFKQSITDCGEAMHDMESKQIDTLQGSLIILSSAWEGLMLSFNESTGPIKTAVDALTELLQTWTKWRNRNQGGDAAIQSYEVTDAEVKQRAEAVLSAMREATNGRTGQKLYGSDDDIKKKIEAENEAFKKQEEELKKLEKAYKDYQKTLDEARNAGDTEKAVGIMETNPLRGTKYMGNGTSIENLYKDAAKLRDQMAINDYILSVINPAPTQVDPAKQAELLEQSKEQIELDAKAHIAALDRKLLSEEEYESKVYQIKKTALEQILKLYNEESKEYARTKARMYDLDIQHQGAVMRFANRANKNSAKDDMNNMSGPAQTPLEALQDSIRRQQADQAAAIDENSLKSLLGVTIQNGLNGLDLDFSQVMSKMWEGMDVSAADWKALEDKINEQLEAMNLKPIKLDVDTGNLVTADKQVKSTTQAWQAAAAAISTVGSALQQIDDPAAKIAGLVATAVAQIALGFAQATAAPATGAAGVFGWIAAATTGLATMISTITAIKSVTSAGSYAEGGIIPGNNYNDGLVANVSSGELILNRAQQDSIAAQLSSGNPFGNLQLSTKLTGTELLILLNNTNRSLGGSRSFYSERH